MGTSGRIRAQAPGKLVLIGEYAVLDGAPALAMAVNRFARVELTDSEDWVALGPAASPKLPLVQGVLDMFEDSPAGGIVDTRDFYHRTGGKLGLGSSAAASVALAGALARRQGETLTGETGWPLLTKTHRQFQRGHGSGIDLACSLVGGVIRFQVGAKRPVMNSVGWPTGLEIGVVFTGESASTAAFLERWSAWRSAEPARAAEVMEALGQSSETGVAAFSSADRKGFLAAIETYGRQLEDLGRRIAMPIVSPVHKAVGQVAQGLGLVYKPSGAGGGDVGIAWGLEGSDWDRFGAEIQAIQGCEPLNLKLATDGLLVESTDE